MRSETDDEIQTARAGLKRASKPAGEHMLAQTPIRSGLVSTLLTVILVLFLPSAASATASGRPAVMILGTFHFTGSESDEISVTMGDMKSPQRQAEIEELIARLMSFAPTKVAVELTPKHEGSFNEKYRKYKLGQHELSANERQQIGMRLAKRLGHDKLYAVDSPQDMDMQRAFAAAQEASQEQEIALFQEKIKEIESSLEQAQSEEKTILDALRFHNGPLLKTGNQIYLRLALFGTAADPAGAEVVGRWYERNLKIYANIARLADSGDERILVIYGSGHAPHLTSFFEQSADFTLVPAMTVLAE